MNNGEIRILVSSTEKEGNGLNIQRNVIGMHHLDIPLKPSELEQRNGRGAWQGGGLDGERVGDALTGERADKNLGHTEGSETGQGDGRLSGGRRSGLAAAVTGNARRCSTT